MKMRTPSFWYSDRIGLRAILLAPLGPVWLLAGWLKARMTRTRSSRLPVVCVGNITAGGTGKTPLVGALAEAAKVLNHKPVILTRGHGGTLKGPVSVTVKMDVRETGDEARMLRRNAPVVIAADRAAGAAFIEEKGLGDLILMDDGMQSRRLRKDRQVAVFSGRLGLGNGLPIPAGPLRERLAGLGRADAVIVTGEDRAGVARDLGRRFPGIPVFTVKRQLKARDVKELNGKPVVAFAGIGDPEGFFAMLEEAGVKILARVPLPDHARLTDSRMDELQALAQSHNAPLVTTEKDAARLDHGDRRPGRATIHMIRLETVLDADLVGHIFPESGLRAGEGAK